MGNCQCLNQEEKSTIDDLNTSKENFRVRSGIPNVYGGGLYLIKEDTDENKISTMNNDPKSSNAKIDFFAIQTINDPELQFQDQMTMLQEPIIVQQKKSLKVKSVSNHFYEAPPKTSIRELEVKNDQYFPVETDESRHEVDISKMSKTLFNLLNQYKIKPKLLIDRLQNINDSSFKSISKDQIIQFLNAIDSKYKGNSFLWDASAFINLRNFFNSNSKVMSGWSTQQIEKDVLSTVFKDNRMKYIYSFRLNDAAEEIFDILISNHFEELRYLLVNNSIDHACVCSSYLSKSEIFTVLILFTK